MDGTASQARTSTNSLRRGETLRARQGNVIQRREQAMERRIRQLPLPTPPGESDDSELISSFTQGLVLGLVGGASAALAIATWAGAL